MRIEFGLFDEDSTDLRLIVRIIKVTLASHLKKLDFVKEITLKTGLKLKSLDGSQKSLNKLKI